MPPGMMPSMAAGSPPGATPTMPGGYLRSTQRKGQLGREQGGAELLALPTVLKNRLVTLLAK